MSNISNIINRRLCKVGRSFDPLHATCQSCVRQLGSCVKKPTSRDIESEIKTTYRGNTLVTTAYLNGLNTWNNKQDKYAYSKERKRWERILTGTFALWPKQEGKRELIITRFVKDQRCILKDRDNRDAAAKPIKDVLVRIGVLADDTDDLLEYEVRQKIDKNNPRTEITIT